MQTGELPNSYLPPKLPFHVKIKLIVLHSELAPRTKILFQKYIDLSLFLMFGNHRFFSSSKKWPIPCLKLQIALSRLDSLKTLENTITPSIITHYNKQYPFVCGLVIYLLFVWNFLNFVMFLFILYVCGHLALLLVMDFRTFQIFMYTCDLMIRWLWNLLEL